jgi:hypothetical protein
MRVECSLLGKILLRGAAIPFVKVPFVKNNVRLPNESGRSEMSKMKTKRL